jgi:hypothetical protein
MRRISLLTIPLSIIASSSNGDPFFFEQRQIVRRQLARYSHSIHAWDEFVYK